MYQVILTDNENSILTKTQYEVPHAKGNRTKTKQTSISRNKKQYTRINNNSTKWYPNKTKKHQKKDS